MWPTASYVSWNKRCLIHEKGFLHRQLSLPIRWNCLCACENFGRKAAILDSPHGFTAPLPKLCSQWRSHQLCRLQAARIALAHQHGLHFIFLLHQYGRVDVTWRCSILCMKLMLKYFPDSLITNEYKTKKIPTIKEVWISDFYFKKIHNKITLTFFKL